MVDDFFKRFSSFQVLPRQSLRVYNRDEDYYFCVGPFSAQTAVKYFWLIKDVVINAEFELGAIVSDNGEILENGFIKSGGALGMNYCCASLAPYKRFLYRKRHNIYNLVDKEKFFNSVYISATIDAPRMYADYPDSTAFEQRQFVFPIHIEISGNIPETNVALATWTPHVSSGSNYFGPINISAFGKTAQGSIYAYTPVGTGVYSGGLNISITSPTFHSL